MIRHILCVVLIFKLLNPFVAPQQLDQNVPGMSRKLSGFLNSGTTGEGHHPVKGKRWALLVAGSSGYENYRHQADVCHAYQILKKGGLDDENIIVFMYDDIALNKENHKQGVIINRPGGPDVYKGVPKDYTGNQTSVHNFFAVLLGNKRAVTGGSGKVLNTGPEDHIFIYYTDHGAPGIISMANGELVHADDLNNALKKKHENKGYKSMVFYLEACESGSMFEGLLPDNINIYATTAANATENSYPTYCDADGVLCLGDTYSVAWMEDSEQHNSRSETLAQQYKVVRHRTLKDDKQYFSHVMQYGDLALSKEFLSSYIGTTQASHNKASSKHVAPHRVNYVSQRDADLHYYSQKVQRTPRGSKKWLEAQKQLQREIDSRKLVDDNIKQISEILLGDQTVDAMMHSARPAGQPLVDDWSCFKAFVKTYEKKCGTLSSYGMKYTRVFANMCNAGVTVENMIMAMEATCK